VCQILIFQHLDTTYIVVYRNPTFSISDFRRRFLETIEQLLNNGQSKIVILGDFNICRATTKDQLEIGLNDLGISSLLNGIGTTKELTEIDWVFSSSGFNDLKAHIYETTYSHHDGVFVSYS